MANNSEITPGSGEFIRTEQKGGSGGPKTQIIGVDIGGLGAESVLNQRNAMPVRGSPGQVLRVGPPEFAFDTGDYLTTGQIAFQEPSGNAVLGPWNDGIGAASIDSKIQFNGKATVRLNPQGNIASGGTPGSSPLTTGVVWKRRFQFALGGIYSAECWIRWTSINNSDNIFTVLDHYNRDGTNAWLGRLWLDPTVYPLSLKIVDSSLAYIEFATVASAPATHQYDLNAAKYDKAGQWTFARLIVDFTTKKYVGAQINDQYYSLSAYNLATIASTGAQAMHFGVSYAGKTSSRRYINVANLAGRRYA